MLRLIFILLSIKFIYTIDNGSTDNDFKSEFCGCKNFIFPISNNSIVNEQDFKFMATIQYLMPKDESELNKNIYINVCSGVIMNSFYILTTALCLDFIRNTNELINFRIGAGTDLETMFTVEDYNRMISNYSYIFSNYDNKIKSTKYNLGLIRLDKPFKLGDNILPACFLNFEENNIKDSDLYLVEYPKIFAFNRYGSDINESIESQENKTKIFLNIFTNTISEPESDPALGFSEFDEFSPVSSSLSINIFRKSENEYPCDGKYIICASSSSRGMGCNEGSPLLHVHKDKLYVIGLLSDKLFESSNECLKNTKKSFVATYSYLSQDNLIQSELEQISSQLCLDENVLNFRSISKTITSIDSTNRITRLSTNESTEIETTTKLSTNKSTIKIGKTTKSPSIETTKLLPIEITTKIVTTTKLPPIKSTTKIGKTTKSPSIEITKLSTTESIKIETITKLQPIRSTTKIDTIPTNFTTKSITDSITTNTIANRTLESKTKLTSISTKLTDKTTTNFKPSTKTTYKTTKSKTKSTSKLTTRFQTTPEIKNASMTTDLPTSSASDLKNLQLNGIKEYLIIGSIVLLILVFILWCCCCKSKNLPIEDNKSLVNVTSFDTKSRSDNKLAKKNFIPDKASLTSLKSINVKSKSDSKLKKKSFSTDKIRSASKSKSSVLKSESLKSIGVVKSLNSKSISLTLPSVQSASAASKSIVSMGRNIKSKKI